MPTYQIQLVKLDPLQPGESLHEGTEIFFVLQSVDIETTVFTLRQLVDKGVAIFTKEIHPSASVSLGKIQI